MDQVPVQFGPQPSVIWVFPKISLAGGGVGGVGNRPLGAGKGNLLQCSGIQGPQTGTEVKGMDKGDPLGLRGASLDGWGRMAGGRGVRNDFQVSSISGESEEQVWGNDEFDTDVTAGRPGGDF